MQTPRFLLAFGILTLGASAALPQEPLGPQSPLELSRGLREQGLPELAQEYLAELAKKPGLPPDVLKMLSIERAKARLDAANTETDEAKRDDMVAMARTEFETFIKANPTHPRLPEFRVSLGRVAFFQGKSYLARAFKFKDAEERKKELARSRPYFRDAAKTFEEASKKLEEMAKAADLPPARQRELLRETYQARLEQGISLYNLGESFLQPRDGDVTLRFNAYKDARSLFIRLGDADTNHPICWIAKAWAIECSFTMPELPVAEKASNEFKDALKKRAAGDAAAEEGNRMFSFFELRRKWNSVSTTSPLTDFQAASKLCTDWLRKYKTNNWTPEHYAVTYYHGTLRVDEAKVRAIGKDGMPIKPTPPEVTKLLQEAQRDFRILTENENDYSARAATERSVAVRLLVGDTVKSPKEYTDFEELHMAAMVQLYKAQEASNPEDKKKHYLTAIPLLEQERNLEIPREAKKEAMNGQIMLIFLYMETGRPHAAAIKAEYLARTSRNSSMIAKSGYNAVLAYLASAAQLLPNDIESKQSDQRRAMEMANYLERTVPEDPVTDAARFQLALLLSREGRTLELFEVCHRISNRFVLAANARLMQGGAAYELLRFRRPEEPKLIPDERKPEIFRIALADMNAVLPPQPSATADQAAAYIRLQMQIAQLQLTNRESGYPIADKLAADAKAFTETYTELKKPENKALALDLAYRAELIRIDAVYGLARIDSDAGKFQEAAERMMPLLVNAAQEKSLVSKLSQDPMLKDDQALIALAKRLDDTRLDRVIGFALNARVRQGDLEKAGELFGLIEQLGGDITRSTMAVYRLVSVTKPQIEDLKKQNKSEEATKLATAVATLVSQIAAKPNLTTEMNYNLGRAFKDLGDYPKAIEMLTKVPKPEDPGYFGNPASADPEEQKKRLAAQMYRNAQLELVQSYVLAKDFAKAEELLEAALGKDPEAIIPNKPNKNWGYRFVEFRKERFRALEAKASTMEIKASTPIWVEAKKGWERIQLEYQNSITRWTPRPPTDLQLGQMAVGGILIYVGPAKEENDRLINTIIKPRYYDAMFEALRCRTDALVYTTKSLPPASQIAPITRVAETIMNVERNSVDMPDEVIAKYQDLMSRLPVLLGEYTKLGGTKFLPKPMMMP